MKMTCDISRVCRHMHPPTVACTPILPSFTHPLMHVPHTVSPYTPTVACTPYTLPHTPTVVCTPHTHPLTHSLMHVPHTHPLTHPLLCIPHTYPLTHPLLRVPHTALLLTHENYEPLSELLQVFQKSRGYHSNPSFLLVVPPPIRKGK